MTTAAVRKRQRTVHGMMREAEPVIKDVEVKENDQFINAADVMEPAALHELVSQVDEMIRKVKEETCPISSFRNVDFESMCTSRAYTLGDFVGHCLFCAQWAAMLFSKPS